MYSVVVSVGYDVLTNLVDGDSSQAVKLTLAIAVATESKDIFGFDSVLSFQNRLKESTNSFVGHGRKQVVSISFFDLKRLTFQK